MEIIIRLTVQSVVTTATGAGLAGYPAPASVDIYKDQHKDLKILFHSDDNFQNLEYFELPTLQIAPSILLYTPVYRT